MAITIVQEPAEIAFSRNPVVFGMQTDNLFNPVGQASVFLLAFPGGPLEEDAAFELSYGSDAIQQLFTIKDAPDDSGLQIRSGKNHPVIADLTMTEWCNQVITYFQQNYLLSRDYTFSVDTAGLEPRVKLTAKVLDPYFNLEVSAQAFVACTQLTNGIKKERNHNFKIHCELWLENEAHTGFDKILANIYGDPDDTGLVTINISKALSESLRGAQNDFDTPNPALPIAFQAKKTSRRYYIRYAEAYGEVQTVRQMQSSDIKWAVLGGVGKFKQTDYSIPTNFLVGGVHRFLKIEPIAKTVKVTQPEWLSMVWLTTVPADVRVHVKVYYSSGSPAETTKYPFNGLLKYDKVTFPAGCTQLNLGAIDPARIITKYELWVENSSNAAVLTEIRTYTLDYTQTPAKFIMELSSFGVYDTFQCYGKGSSEYDINSDKAVISRSASFRFSEGETINFDNNIEIKEVIRTGWQSRREIARYRDLFLSWDKFLIRNGRMYPIATNTKSIKEFDDNIHNYALEFEVGFRYTEELYSEEDDPSQAISLAQFIPLISNPTPANYDDLYYRKAQVYNKGEIDAFIASTLAIEAAHYAQLSGLITALTADLAGKADVNHNHDLAYVGFAEFNAFADAVGDAILYKGLFNAAYSVDPLDPSVILGYRQNDVVDHKGSLWRSLTDDNVTEPSESEPSWVEVIAGIKSKTIVLADFEPDLITVSDPKIKTIKTMFVRNIGPMINEVDFTTLVGGGFVINYTGFEANSDTAISLTYKEY